MNQTVRIAAASDLPAVFELGGWRVFADRNEIEGPRGVVRLEPMSMRLLCLLAEHAGRTVTRAQVVERLWEGRAVTHDAVTRQVAKLREAFGDDAREPQVVKTVPKVGFLLLIEPQAPAAAREDAPARALSHSSAATPARGKLVWAIVAVAAVAIVGSAAAGLLRRQAGDPIGVGGHPLTAEVGRELEPALSPNGAWLAYVAQPAEGEPGVLWVRTLRGAARRLTPAGVDARRPAWSPDMTRLAFVQKDERGCALALASPLDGMMHRVGDCRAADLGGLAWLDAGTLIVSDRSAPQAGFRLARLDLASGQVRPLTGSGVDGPNLGDTDPVASADGKSVYFVRTAAPGASDVFALDLASGRVRQVTRDGANIHGLTRGRGGRLVVASNRLPGATYTLWSVNSRGSDWRRLTDEVRSEYPSSPDGRVIAYQRRDFQMSLWSVPLDGGAAERVTATSRRDRTPAYSRDGRRLAFLSDRSGAVQLWVADADGATRQVSDLQALTPREPAWSPDGRSVVLAVRDGGQFDLGAVDVATGAFQFLAKTKASERYPVWSRDGRRLYFIRGDGDRYALYQRTSDGRERRLLDDAVRAAEGDDGVLYVQRLAKSGFWRFDPDGGRLQKIGELPGVDPRSWALADGAVWALTGTEGGQLVRLDLHGGAVQAVRTLPGLYPRAGLAVHDGVAVVALVESENTDVYSLGDLG